MDKIKESIKKDHRQLGDMLKAYQKLKDEDESEAKKLFHEIQSRIERHVSWEERILFPRIEARICMNLPPPSIRARSQHREIEKIIEKICEQVVHTRRQTNELKGKLADLWEQHDRELERILYPWIDLSLSEQEKEEALDLMDRSAVGHGSQ